MSNRPYQRQDDRQIPRQDPPAVNFFLLFFAEGNNIGSVLPPQKSAGISWTAILKGVSLAFFAFIGFEDIVNVAEEIKRPEHTLPIGILVAASVAGILYVGVAWISSHLVSSGQLAASDSPLLDVVNASPLALPREIAIRDCVCSYSPLT